MRCHELAGSIDGANASEVVAATGLRPAEHDRREAENQQAEGQRTIRDIHDGFLFWMGVTGWP
jgi:hypothetical protein